MAMGCSWLGALMLLYKLDNNKKTTVSAQQPNSIMKANCCVRPELLLLSSSTPAQTW